MGVGMLEELRDPTLQDVAGFSVGVHAVAALHKDRAGSDSVDSIRFPGIGSQSLRLAVEMNRKPVFQIEMEF